MGDSSGRIGRAPKPAPPWPYGRARGRAALTPIRCRNLEIRLAETSAEIEAAQALRYRVFVEDLGAVASEDARRLRRDVDAFDSACDHLIVVDRETEHAPRVVGTYRLLPRSRALAAGGFYSAQEYDLAPLLAYPGEVMELGRSCVDAAYRGRAIMQLLWRGIAAYTATRRVEVMFGCASFHGTELDEIRQALSYLHYVHLAPGALRPSAVAERYIDMRLVEPDRLDEAAAQAALPPLIKGYLRLGGFVGDGAVIDAEFNTIDVCIIVKTDLVTDWYFRHFRPSATALERHATFPAEPARPPGLAFS